MQLIDLSNFKEEKVHIAVRIDNWVYDVKVFQVEHLSGRVSVLTIKGIVKGLEISSKSDDVIEGKVRE